METPRTIKQNLLNNIKQIRITKGYSLNYIAEKMGHSYTFYALIESGKRGLEFETLCEIADILNYSVVDLITYPDTLKKIECKECKQKDEIIKNLQDYIRLLKESTTMGK